MADESLEKTEPATPKKRQDARKRGEVAQSRDLSSALLALAALGIAISGAGALFAHHIGQYAQALWSGSWVRPGSISDYHAVLLATGSGIGWAALPLISGLLAVAVLAPIIQSGPLFSAEALSPKWSKLDPLAGLKRMATLERVFDLGKSMVKLVAIASAVGWVIGPQLGLVLSLGAAPLEAVVETQIELGTRVTISAIVALLVLGVIDLAWVRWRHEDKLKMSKQELRDELKQREGSPELRGRMRAAQRDLSQSRMLAEVATADVVVRNPTHFAVALRYDRAAMGAPTVVAKGRNRVAERILRAAQEHGVPVVENRPVAQLLYRTAKLGQQIPEGLYEVVAQILAHVYRADRRRGARAGART